MQGLTSPVRSVHPEMLSHMESIHSQADFGHRTADFFEDGSSDDGTGESANIAPDVDLDERRGSVTKRRQRPSTTAPFKSQCESKRATVGPHDEGYLRLTPQTPFQNPNAYANSPGTSFHGSVDELLPGEHIPSSSLRVPHQVHMPGGRIPRSSEIIDRTDFARRNTSDVPSQSLQHSSKVDQILGAHAMAHEITLQALMRDEDALDRGMQSFAPLQAGERGSILHGSLRFNDPRSPRSRAFSTPSAKKVHVVPPPIDTSVPHRSIPANIVRTPYPFSPPTHVHRKDFGQGSIPTPAAATNPAVDSVITLSIRRSNPHSRTRISSLIIPASNDFTAVKTNSNGEAEKYFKEIDFDDEEFFRQLKRSYRSLVGPMRFLSARSLSRVVVSGSATRAADAGYGWLHVPRSPRLLAQQGLSDTFSEEKLMRHLRRPASGRARYAWVHWAHRLAAASPIGTPQPEQSPGPASAPDLLRGTEAEGLEFVVSWSLWRIAVAVVLVLILSATAALLWVFLGRNTIAGVIVGGGFRDAGDRVAAGVLMGICVLLLGLTGIVGWLGVSWLVM